MELSVFEQLMSPAGQKLLAAAMELQPSEKTFLANYETLRKHGSSDLAKAAVETAILRAKARIKFPDADRMYFTREALEQSSSFAVATYRAQRFGSYGIVGDLCCGIGADALALSSIIPNVIAFESDPLKARMAMENAPKALVLTADVLTEDLEIHLIGAFFCDPSRRADGKRFLSLADYLPSPQAVLDRFPRGTPAAFKLAPAVPLEELSVFDGEAEFISLDGELKECVLWLNGLQLSRFSATALPSGLSISADKPDDPPPVGPVARYVYDPDPSLTRSGLLTNFAHSIGASLLDESIAFLTSDVLHYSPFVTTYEVEESLPFHAKRLGEWLKSRNIGRVTPVKRGSSANVDELTKQWKLKGDDHRDLLLTRCEGKPVAIVARRIGS
jgi:THUMP domain-like